MENFTFKSIVVLTLAAALSTSCEKNSGSSSSIPKWEFDITLDGTNSHFKYNKNASMYCYAKASIDLFYNNVQLRGNMTSDPEWVSGEPARISITFDEAKLGQQHAILEWNSNSQIQSVGVTIDIRDLGTPTTSDSTGVTSWGKMLVVDIPAQTCNIANFSHTIVGSFKAVRTN